MLTGKSPFTFFVSVKNVWLVMKKMIWLAVILFIVHLGNVLVGVTCIAIRRFMLNNRNSHVALTVITNVGC